MLTFSNFAFCQHCIFIPHMLGNIPNFFNISLISYAYSALINFVNIYRYFLNTIVTSLFRYIFRLFTCGTSVRGCGECVCIILTHVYIRAVKINLYVRVVDARHTYIKTVVRENYELCRAALFNYIKEKWMR
jgi:hypothetical protein